MTRFGLVRVATLLLAYVHSFPAQKHVARFLAEPSLGEAWKGFGACAAIALYLLPPRVQARGLAALLRRHRVVLSSAAFALAAAHVVPALDHIPRFMATPSWSDGWRAAGAAIAAAWFALPMRSQGRVVAFTVRLPNVLGGATR